MSVVVVSYNTRELLARCLSSCAGVHEIIVVDNASTDGSAAMVRSDFPDVVLIENSDNRGFGSANNQGMDRATGDLILLLNSDAEAKPGAIDSLASVFADPGIVAAGGRLLSPDGSTQNSCSDQLTLWAVFCEQFLLEKALPRSTFFSPYWLTHRLIRQGSDAVYDVEQVMGACLMMRPGWRFDEDFFLYCEDTELCYRMRKECRIVYVPSAEFEHALGASSTVGRWRSVARYNFGKALYFRKHFGVLQSVVCQYVNRTGAVLRILLAILLLAILCIISIPVFVYFLISLGNKDSREGIRNCGILCRRQLDKIGIFSRVLFAGAEDPRKR